VSLYKYFNPERIDVLSTRRIRYSQPFAFNDPFEAKPDYTGLADETLLLNAFRRRFQRDLETWYEIMPQERRRNLTKEQFLLTAKCLQSETDEVFRKDLETFALPKARKMMHTMFGEGIGVLSLTEVNDNLLMWSHYAAGHTGFVLEFDESHGFFGGRKATSDEIWGLHKVRYSDKRPQTIVSELNTIAMLLTKGKVWEYEIEWRAFRPLNQAATRKDTLPYPIYLFDLPVECIRSIIFGARMTIETRESVRFLIGKTPGWSHIQVLQAVIDEKVYALHAVPET
jgi:hypothetical protein